MWRRRIKVARPSLVAGISTALGFIPSCPGSQHKSFLTTLTPHNRKLKTILDKYIATKITRGGIRKELYSSKSYFHLFCNWMTFQLQAVLLPTFQGTSTPVSPVAIPVPLQGHSSRHLTCFKVSTSQKDKRCQIRSLLCSSFLAWLQGICLPITAEMFKYFEL